MIAENDCRRRLDRIEKSDNDDGAKNIDNEEHSGEEDDEEEEEDDDQDDPEDLAKTMTIIDRLRSHLDEFFPVKYPIPEPSMILHDDLSRHNILVNEDGSLSAVVDWECISAQPLWMACQYPPILQGKPVDVQPIKSKYQHDQNGDVVELYWEHLEDYELTQLRKVFLDEIWRSQPGWVEVFESSQRQRDFDLALTNCDDEFLMWRIGNWLDDMENGVQGFMGLEERIDNASL